MTEVSPETSVGLSMDEAAFCLMEDAFDYLDNVRKWDRLNPGSMTDAEIVQAYLQARRVVEARH